MKERNVRNTNELQRSFKEEKPTATDSPLTLSSFSSHDFYRSALAPDYRETALALFNFWCMKREIGN